MSLFNNITFKKNETIFTIDSVFTEYNNSIFSDYADITYTHDGETKSVTRQPLYALLKKILKEDWRILNKIDGSEKIKIFKEAYKKLDENTPKRPS